MTPLPSIMSGEERRALRKAGWDAGLIFLAFVSAALLAFEVTADLTYEQNRAIQLADLLISLIFLGEYIWSMVHAPRPWRYAVTHWYDLLASLPVTNETVRTFRILRIARIVRLFRAFRFLIRLRTVLRHSTSIVGEARVFTIVLAALATVFFSAFTFHYFEYGHNPGVHTLFDSVWWALVTVTTVGYGDIVPVTTAGRLVAIFLMLTGIGTLGALTTSIITHVIRRQASDQPPAANPAVPTSAQPHP